MGSFCRSFLVDFGWVIADQELQYDHLAAGLAQALKADPTAFDAKRLKCYTGLYNPLALLFDQVSGFKV